DEQTFDEIVDDDRDWVDAAEPLVEALGGRDLLRCRVLGRSRQRLACRHKRRRYEHTDDQCRHTYPHLNTLLISQVTRMKVRQTCGAESSPGLRPMTAIENTRP